MDRTTKLVSAFSPRFISLVFCLAITPVQGQSELPPIRERDRAMTMAGDFTFASVGDLMIRRPASQLADPEVQEVFDLIRNADLAMGNMEGELANIREFDGPLNGFVGTHEVAADLRLMGFDMVNRAQNHLLMLSSLACFQLIPCWMKQESFMRDQARTYRKRRHRLFWKPPRDELL